MTDEVRIKPLPSTTGSVAGERFKPGDRVEVDGEPGTVIGVDGDQALVWRDRDRVAHGQSAPAYQAIAEAVRVPVLRPSMIDDEILTPQEAARRLRISQRTLEAMRTRGSGPAYAKYGEGRSATIVYRLSQIMAWVAGRERTSTSTDGQ